MSDNKDTFKVFSFIDGATRGGRAHSSHWGQSNYLTARLAVLSDDIQIEAEIVR